MTLPDQVRHLPPPIGWDYLALPPGGPLTTDFLSTGIAHLTVPVIPWWVVFTFTVQDISQTQDVILQITQPEGVRHQVVAIQYAPAGPQLVIVAGAAVPQLPSLSPPYTQIQLPLRPWTPPIGVGIRTTSGALVTGGIIPHSTWLVFPQGC